MKLGEFSLPSRKGQFSTGQLIVLLGENGIGKTTFIETFAGIKRTKM